MKQPAKTLSQSLLQHLQQALDDNPEITRSGYLELHRIAYCEQGVGSYQGQAEMVVAISFGSCYGHVFCHQSENGKPLWASILSQTNTYVDGATPRDVLVCFWRDGVRGCDSYPLYRQQADDVHSFHDSFDEAAQALAEKIKRFKWALRTEVSGVERTETGWVDYGMTYPPEGSEMDLFYHELYQAYDKTGQLKPARCSDGHTEKEDG